MVKQFALDLLDAYLAIPGKMMEIGRRIIEGLWKGIQEKWQAVKDGVTGIASSITTSIKSKLGIKSPSKVMHEIGVDIMSGLANGMRSMEGEIEGITGDASSGIQGAFSNIGSSIAGLIKGTTTWRDVLADVLQNLSQAIFQQSNVSQAFGGGGFGGFMSSLLGGLLGFAKGGTILPGGAGGVDSQLVVFRKSPNERVDITKPGQTLHSGQDGPVNINVNVDGANGDQHVIMLVRQGVQAGLAQYDRQLSMTWGDRTAIAQRDQL